MGFIRTDNVSRIGRHWIQISIADPDILVGARTCFVLKARIRLQLFSLFRSRADLSSLKFGSRKSRSENYGEKKKIFKVDHFIRLLLLAISHRL